MQIKILKSVTEINKLTDLFTKVFAEPPYKEKWDKKLAHKRIELLLTRADGNCLYVEEHNKVIGLIFCQTPIWPDGNHLIIEDLVVHPLHRGKGVGATLVRKIEDTAKKKGVPVIDLLVNSRAEATLFWERLGYKQTAYVQFSKKV